MWDKLVGMFSRSTRNTPPATLAGWSPETIKAARQIRAALAKSGRLHLGCGSVVMEGWVNVDLEPGSGGFKWDLTQPIPGDGASASLVFAEHFIEHIDWNDGQRLMADCRRLLCNGGILRLSTPDLKFLVEEYLRGRTTEWSDMGWTPETPCQMLNEGMRSWGHQYLYDRTELHRALVLAGFSAVRDVGWRRSEHPELQRLECRPWHRELIVEAIR